MPLRTAVFSSALLVLSAAPLCVAELSFGDILSNLTTSQNRHIKADLERLDNRLTVLQNQLTAAQSADAECPWGWSRHGNSCYLIPAVTATWFGASVLCADMDRRARLVSVHAHNHQFIEEMIAASGVHEVWAGGVRLRHGGIDWGWTDGTTYDFANWAPGASSTNVGEDCIIMRGPKSGYNAEVGQWHDGFCCHPGSNFNFMCQIALRQGNGVATGGA